MQIQKPYSTNLTCKSFRSLFGSSLIGLIISGCATQHQPVVKRPFINFQNLECRPEYPRAALPYEQQGTVIFDIQVGAEGSILSVEINKSSGFPLLDEAVRSAVLRDQCKATPGTIDGYPSAMALKLQYVWKLD